MTAYKLLTTTAQTALIGMALLLPPTAATALEWTLAPSLSVGTTGNDNINLVPSPRETVYVTTISPGLLFGAKSARSSVSGLARINRLDYSPNSEQSRTNALLDLTYIRQYERSQFLLTGKMNRDSTLDNELLDTGIVNSWAQRTARTLAPSWVYSLTERDTLNLGYSYLDVTYDSTASSSSLTDYTSAGPSLTLSHAFSEKNRINLSLAYSDYQSQSPVTLTSNKYRYQTSSAQLGFSRNISDTLSVSVMAGGRKTDSTIDYLTCSPLYPNYCFPIPATEVTNSDVGSLFSATLRKSFETSKLTADFSRSLQPTAEDGLVQTDRLSGSYDFELKPRLRGMLNMSIYQTESSSPSSISQDRRYYKVTPTLSWEITEWWAASASYSRAVAENTQDTDSTESSSNAIQLTLIYNWPKISVSR